MSEIVPVISITPGFFLQKPGPSGLEQSAYHKAIEVLYNKIDKGAGSFIWNIQFKNDYESLKGFISRSRCKLAELFIDNLNRSPTLAKRFLEIRSFEKLRLEECLDIKTLVQKTFLDGEEIVDLMVVSSEEIERIKVTLPAAFELVGQNTHLK